MELFIYLAEFPFVICKECRFGCVADEIATHLQVQHSYIKSEVRKTISTAVQSTPGIVHKRAELAGFVFPEPTTAAIPYIQEVKSDGLRCRECPYVNRRAKHMKDYCRQEHGWQNLQKRGRLGIGPAEHTLPWIEGVCCQRFFLSQQASGWFEVG